MAIGWSSSQVAAAARWGCGTAAGQRQRVITETCRRISRAEPGQKRQEKCIRIRETTILLDTSHVEKKVRLSW